MHAVPVRVEVIIYYFRVRFGSLILNELVILR